MSVNPHPRRQVLLNCRKKTGKTKQEFRDEADINTVVENFQRTGQLGNVSPMQPTYGDFSAVVSYHEALNLMNESDQLFQELPAKVRDKFQNDPEKLVDFVRDPANRKEAEEIGLIATNPSPAPTPTPSATIVPTNTPQPEKPAIGESPEVAEPPTD